MLAFELVGVFVISTSILNLQVYSVMKMSDAIIFLHKNNQKKSKKILMYCGLLTCFFLNLGRGIGTCSGRSWSMNLTFKHTSNRSWLHFLVFHSKASLFLGIHWEEREQRTHSSFLGMLFLPSNRSFPGNGTLSMKVFMEFDRRCGFFWLEVVSWSLERSLQCPARVTRPLLGTSWAFSPWQTPQTGLKIKQHLSPSWGWAGRGSGEGLFCVCLGFLLLSLLWFSPFSSSFW